MKILDKFLMRSFVGPFIVAFFIALFVLIMQFLWLYIDEMMGKGLTIFDVSELLFYLSIGFVPQALPIGILISTVMVMGNLAERYELSSFKSAGVSLLRVMRPLFYAVSVVALFSFFTSEILIPWGNLKFYSRFYDIRKSKPALNLEAGVFNDEFANFTLRIGRKYGDGSQLQEVLIYDKGINTNMVKQTIAKKGEMLNSDDRQFIVMNLYDGVRYEETTGNNGQQSGKNPFVRTKFSSWKTIFDLSEFDRKKTDEDLFKNNQKMLSSRQLWGAMDSMSRLNGAVASDLTRTIRETMSPLKSKVVQLPPSSGASSNITVENSTPSVENKKMAENVVVNPPKTMDDATLKKIKKGEKNIPTSLESVRSKLDSINKISRGEGGINTTPQTVTVVKKDSFRNKALVDDFYGVVPATAQSERMGLEQRAENSAKNVQSNIENTMRQSKLNNEQRGKFVYELHMKYTAAIICLVFLFIGAPMGAIIQKGGFGYPILVAIGFFVVYIIGTIYCKNIKDAGGMSATSAAWMPVLFMLPIALVLTWRAVNDYKMSFDGTGKKLKILYDKTIGKWVSRRKKAIV